MLKAVVREGKTKAEEPLPSGWTGGTPLVIEEAEAPADPEQLDRWYEELEALVAECDPADIARLQQNLAEADREAKERMRREMGLNPL